MQINVSQQLKEAIGAKRSYEVDETVDIADQERPVKGRVNLVRTDRGILIRGNLHTDIEVTCSRCLNLCLCPLTLAIEEEYFPTTDILTGAPVAVPEQSDYFTINEQHILDLDEAIRQLALLASPMKPLCKANCAGLCPSCGHNLNLGPCDCPKQNIDPRWTRLQELTIASDDNNTATI